MPRLRIPAAALAAGLLAAAGLAAAGAALVLSLTRVTDPDGATVAWGLSGALGAGGLGALVVSQRPRLLAGWLLLVAGVSSGGSVLAATIAAAELPGDPASGVGAAAFWVST